MEMEPTGKPAAAGGERKACGASRSIMTQLVFPQDTNHHGTMFGGKVMEYIDKLAAIAAMRHSARQVVTASSDSLDFLAPIRLGEVIVVEAFVTWTNRSSMEVYVKVRAEDPVTGESRITVTSFLTFVALDEGGRPCPVPEAYPETDEEKRLHASAKERFGLRMKRKLDRKNESRL
ncbi:acyl-CoA thioesterase [Paenibacillus sp.]|uniref:acyl-CoA thioesterase n=1 Tax=Paenibacillus sp. TaxID=58172 RepID=UPI0039C9725B